MNAQDPYVGDTSVSPVPVFGIGSIICALLSAGIMAAYLPKPVPWHLSIIFLIGSVVLLVAAVISLLMRRNFAWKRFFTVVKWVVLMTLVITGMLLYVFIFDGMRGSSMVILIAVLVITAIDIPILWGFSVARHERVFPNSK